MFIDKPDPETTARGDQPCPDPGITEQKANLRQFMIKQREQLAPEQVIAWSAAMARQLLIFLQGQAADHGCLALYAAMRGEADLQPAITEIQARGWTVCYPRVIGLGSAARLVFVPLPAGCPPEDYLVQGRFGVLEPPLADTMDPDQLCAPDIIILPGLAFDHQGNRLGWGKAYYDRYLAERTRPHPAGSQEKRPVLLGAAYAFQVIPAVPVAGHDRPVDYLLLPEGVVRNNP
jgi:5-formyltetrahydrofolate cyclo-ligase